MLPYAIRVKPPGESWEALGVDRWRGVHPSPPVMSANAMGPDTCGFVLRRDPRLKHPDLAAWTPCEIEVGGRIVWGGRVRETPTKHGRDRQINVEGTGWQYHLDDDTLQKLFVHTRLRDWRDSRSFLTTPLANFLAGLHVQGHDGAITLVIPRGYTLSGTSDRVGVTLDLGPVCLAKRVVLTWESGGMNTFYDLVLRGTDDENPASGSGETPLTINNPAGATNRASFTTSRRYVHIYLRYTAGPSTTPTTDTYIRLTSVKVFGDTAYESGDASILKASQVVNHAHSSGALPLLSSDVSRISTTSFSIFELAVLEDKTPREVLQAVNAFHNYRLGVDAGARLVFGAFPSEPAFVVDSEGIELDDASANSGDEIYDQVVVQATGPDGQPLRVKRTQTGTLVNLHGFHRTRILPINASLDTAACNQIGDVWLAGHRSTPLRGGGSIGSEAVRRVPGGEMAHPSELLLAWGELLELRDQIDPDTGAIGRYGRLASLTYNHATEVAAVSIDNERRNFEAFVGRLAAVQGAG